MDGSRGVAPCDACAEWTEAGGPMFEWLRGRKQSTLIHDEFGQLVLEDGWWHVETTFPAADTIVGLRIRDVDGNPAAGAGNALRELGRRYGDLRPALAVELRQLFAPWYEEFFKSREPLEHGETLMQRFELGGIEIDADGKISVLEFFLKEGWDDAIFRVSLFEWVPKGLGVDD
jgi:hypothetical protein